MATSPPPPPLQWRNVDAVPLVHGRLPFALEVRRRLLDQRYAALAVELPPSLRRYLQEGVRRLPVIHAVVYREPSYAMEWGAAEAEPGGRRAWFVPVDPCDGVVEALRFAERERLPVHFLDAEVEQFAGRTALMPDSFALLSLGLEPWYQALLPVIRQSHPVTPEDRRRESHMAARLGDLSRRVGNRGRILFLCGLAHWERIHGHLEAASGRRDPAEGPATGDIELVPLEEPLLHAVLGEIPFATWCWEQHRSGISLDDHDAIHAVKELLVAARDRYEVRHDDASLERASPGALRMVLDYARKMTVRRRRLVPDLFTLVVAAKGVVGNDFALALVEVARSYPPNHHLELPDAAPEETGGEPAGDVGPDAGTGSAAAGPEDPAAGEPPEDEGPEQWISRAPGEHREMRRVRLLDRPPKVDQERWRSAWSPHQQCSWPPEDVVVENLRSYVSQRCLTLAGLDRVRTEEFQASLKDGLDLRETLRDPRGKLHVREEPRVPGQVGAVVLIFEEDDAGLQYPWRTTWLAEHDQESTLAFYATDYLQDIVGPGIGRARYGGCLFLFPPLYIPDVWDDLRFEKARRPSERLLLAALAWSRDRFVAYVANRPPSPEARATAEAMGRHIVHLPLSSFSARTLEKARKVHVLNGQFVRSWAAQFIR